MRRRRSGCRTTLGALEGSGLVLRLTLTGVSLIRSAHVPEISFPPVPLVVVFAESRIALPAAAPVGRRARLCAGVILQSELPAQEAARRALHSGPDFRIILLHHAARPETEYGRAKRLLPKFGRGTPLDEIPVNEFELVWPLGHEGVNAESSGQSAHWIGRMECNHVNIGKQRTDTRRRVRESAQVLLAVASDEITDERRGK